VGEGKRARGRKPGEEEEEEEESARVSFSVLWRFDE